MNIEIGTRVGSLVVLSAFVENRRSKVKVRCDCGGEKILFRGNLAHAKSCGCRIDDPRRFRPGESHGRLTLIEPDPSREMRWLARCDCGTVISVNPADMRIGHTKSCGCFKREKISEIKTTHGRTETGEYSSWCKMLGRCYNETDHKYLDYGGRGIQVCERWRGSFENFLADMGERPSPKHSINRLDNDGPYAVDNCNWATALEQGQNKRNNVRLLLNGESVVAAEAARRLGISYSTIGHLAKVRDCSQQEALDFLSRKYAHRARRIALEGVPAAGNA